LYCTSCHALIFLPAPLELGQAAIDEQLVERLKSDDAVSAFFAQMSSR
jgi:hypothetical protein